MAYELEVAAGRGLGSEPWVNLQQVRAVVVIIKASWPTSPSSSSTCNRCHGGSAISDTHPGPRGVASACRTHCLPLTRQHLQIRKKWMKDLILYCRDTSQNVEKSSTHLNRKRKYNVQVSQSSSTPTVFCDFTFSA